MPTVQNKRTGAGQRGRYSAKFPVERFCVWDVFCNGLADVQPRFRLKCPYNWQLDFKHMYHISLASARGDGLRLLRVLVICTPGNETMYTNGF